jgi:hypothetical protein
MTDERDPTTTIINKWLVSIWDGVVSDKRTVGDVHEELIDVARAVRDIGRDEWADKIETAAKAVRPDWDEGPDVIIDRLLDDLHADMAAEWREQRGRAGRLGRDDTPDR